MMNGFYFAAVVMWLGIVMVTSESFDHRLTKAREDISHSSRLIGQNNMLPKHVNRHINQRVSNAQDSVDEEGDLKSSLGDLHHVQSNHNYSNQPIFASSRKKRSIVDARARNSRGNKMVHHIHVRQRRRVIKVWETKESFVAWNSGAEKVYRNKGRRFQHTIEGAVLSPNKHSIRNTTTKLKRDSNERHSQDKRSTVLLQKGVNKDTGKRKKQGIPLLGFPRKGHLAKPRHGPSIPHGAHYFMPALHKLFSHGVEHRYVGGPIHRYLTKPIDIDNIGQAGSVRHFSSMGGGPNPCVIGTRINNIGPCIQGSNIEHVGHVPHVQEIGPIGGMGAGGIGAIDGVNLGGLGGIGGIQGVGGGGGGSSFEELDSYGNNRFGTPKVMNGEEGTGMPFVFPGRLNNQLLPPVHHTERVPFPVPVMVNRPVHHTVQVPFPVPVRGPSRIVVVNRPVPMPPKVVPVPVMVPGPSLPPKVMAFHHLHIINSPCEVSPCRNGATCSAVGTDFRCVCALGYKGDRCDVQSKCIPNPCKNFGKCTELTNDYECICHSGFHGKNCDVESKCEPNPCHNGGLCTETRDQYICSCSHGFMGKNCEQESKCHPVNPCQNNGVCGEDLGGYKCACADNYDGINCEVRLNNNACQSSPCLNRGTCVEDPGDQAKYSCNCPPGFTGETCQVFFSNRAAQMCEPNPCLFGGRCIPNGFSFDCICPDGHNGRHCEVSLTVSCDGCSRHAMCVDDNKCVCKPGYTGDGYHCKKKKVYCHPNPCENAGTCHEEMHTESAQSEWWCECQKGYSGQTCTKYDPCTDFTCHNGGRCQSNGGQPQCTCVPPYTGASCELDNACLPSGGKSRNPCLNGGTCQFNNLQVQCACPPGYEGSDCSKNKCDRCDPNASCKQGECKCKPPWTGDGFRCIVIEYKPTPVVEIFCHADPCENGATCVEGKTTFFCICTADYYGRTCAMRREVKIIYRERENFYSNLCHPNPCLHGGICKEVNEKDFECICANPRYKGRFCDVDMCSECDAHARCVHGKCVCKDGYEGDGYTCTKEAGGCSGGCPLYAQCESNVCVCQPGYTSCTTNCPAGKRSCISLPSSAGITKALVSGVSKTANAIAKGSVHRISSAPHDKTKALSKDASKDKLSTKSTLKEWSEDIIVTEYQSLGCWADTPNWRDPLSRALISLEGLDSKITGNYHTRKQPISKCAEIARGLGYKIFAIQNSGQCFSGPASRDYKKYGPSEKCRSGVGGALANDVYKL